jgi:hypothetical protein
VKRKIAQTMGPPPWSWSTRMRFYRHIARQVFLYGDTTTIRVQLALASTGFAIGLLLPLHTFEREAFRTMRALAPEWVWAIGFIVHSIGVFWRMVDLKPRLYWAFGINAFGLFLWILSSGLITQAIGVYSPGMAMELTVILAALVALIRTGLNDEQVTP